MGGNEISHKLKMGTGDLQHNMSSKHWRGPVFKISLSWDTVLCIEKHVIMKWLTNR